MATPPQIAPQLASPSKRVKGKFRIDEGASPPVAPEETDDEPAECCGICLSEVVNGGVSRGHISSCNHYFCFVCIMEWAKVESRCPLCKRRFSTIRRPPKPPLFTSERVVHVPVRDQVYHYYGNATSGPQDPYSEAKCTVCHGIADESLLLLCDLCDCAVHTYCVGLGATVPEGDWFCPDCTLLRDEHSKNETNAESVIQISSDPGNSASSSDGHSALFDVVQEPYSHAVQRYRITSSGTLHLTHPSIIDDEASKSNTIDGTSPKNLETVTQTIDGTSPKSLETVTQTARTLQHCRSLHDRIRFMRENWNGFQSGIMHFSSTSDDGNVLTQKPTTSTSGHSCLNPNSAARGGMSGITDDVRTCEVEKAWKMMEKAKSVKQRNERLRIAHKNSKDTVRKMDASKNADYMTYARLSSESKFLSKNAGSIRQRSCFPSLEKSYHKQTSLESRKQEWRSHGTLEKFCESSKARELKSSECVQVSSIMCDVPAVDCETLHREQNLRRTTCLSSPAESQSALPNIDFERFNHASSSHRKVKKPVEKGESKEIRVDNDKYCDAKTEIRSLVKLYLKLQTDETKLEVDTFKEVARLATHSILAACGFEHPKPGLCSVPGFVCPHPGVQLQKVSLMPNSCRECFYAFVKDIVSTSIVQKKMRLKKT